MEISVASHRLQNMTRMVDFQRTVSVMRLHRTILLTIHAASFREELFFTYFTSELAIGNKSLIICGLSVGAQLAYRVVTC